MTKWPTPRFGASDWVLHHRQRLASGFFPLDQLTLSHAGYQSETVGPMSRELMLREPAVVVILCDPVLDAVVMVEQFRVGAALSKLDDSPWLLEWVAGICDPGEQPIDTVAREVTEETGLQLSAEPEHLFTYYPSPGGSNELIHLYYASCDASQVSQYRSQASEHEDIRVHVISLQTAFDALATGQVNNAATIMGLQWLAAHRSHWKRGR